MAREIKESDWKLFRQLHGIALERFSQRVLEEVRLAATDAKDGYHGCYLKGVCANPKSRSNNGAHIQ